MTQSKHAPKIRLNRRGLEKGFFALGRGYGCYGISNNLLIMFPTFRIVVENFPFKALGLDWYGRAAISKAEGR